MPALPRPRRAGPVLLTLAAVLGALSPGTAGVHAETAAISLRPGARRGRDG